MDSLFPEELGTSGQRWTTEKKQRASFCCKNHGLYKSTWVVGQEDTLYPKKETTKHFLGEN